MFEVEAFTSTPDLRLEKLANPKKITQLKKWVMWKCQQEAVLTVIPVFSGGKVVDRWSFHTQRLEKSAKLAHIPNFARFCTEKNGEPVYRTIVRKFCKKINLQIPEGAITQIIVLFDVNYMSKDVPRIIVAIQPWAMIDRNQPKYIQGQSVCTLPPNIKPKIHAKELDWFRKRNELYGNHCKYGEILLTKYNEQGEIVILEGAASNFIGVVDEKTFYVPERDLLLGLNREILITVLENQGYQIIYESPTIDEALKLRELWLSTAGDGLWPICRLNDCGIGNNVPGPIYQHINSLFNQQLKSELRCV